jgi:hypothetical protein
VTPDSPCTRQVWCNSVGMSMRAMSCAKAIRWRRLHSAPVEMRSYLYPAATLRVPPSRRFGPSRHVAPPSITASCYLRKRFPLSQIVPMDPPDNWLHPPSCRSGPSRHVARASITSIWTLAQPCVSLHPPALTSSETLLSAPHQKNTAHDTKTLPPLQNSSFLVPTLTHLETKSWPYYPR